MTEPAANTNNPNKSIVRTMPSSPLDTNRGLSKIQYANAIQPIQGEAESCGRIMVS